MPWEMLVEVPVVDKPPQEPQVQVYGKSEQGFDLDGGHSTAMEMMKNQ